MQIAVILLICYGKPLYILLLTAVRNQFVYKFHEPAFTCNGKPPNTSVTPPEISGYSRIPQAPFAAAFPFLHRS